MKNTTVQFYKMLSVFSQERFDRYVSAEVRTMTRAREKGHRDFVGMTDEEILKGAKFLARVNNGGEIFVRA